jgi:hypothetical protein
MDTPTVKITLELRLEGETPAGTARLAGGDEKHFAGWIGLVAALDEIVEGLHTATSATSDSRRSS